MTELEPGISPCPAPLARGDLRAMMTLARRLFRLSQTPDYQAALALPEVARFDPGHHGVMMGYDFHLTPAGPRLIEINTNAGGFSLALRSRQQADRADDALEPATRPLARLLHIFARETGLFRGTPPVKPARVVILDENPVGEFLYPEMAALAELFQRWGVPALVAAPGELEMSAAGVFHAGARVELVYNRHCDFYLEAPHLSGLRAAYLAGTVCLTPNPRVYGLLGDKQRLILLSDRARLQELGLPQADVETVLAMVPETRLLGAVDLEQAWSARKHWVFKPANQFGGRGVLTGEKVSRQRFNTLDPTTTLIQKHIPPSVVPCIHGNMKADVRLFVYQDLTFLVGIRLYRGQVTNFREPGSGYGPVRLI